MPTPLKCKVCDGPCRIITEVMETREVFDTDLGENPGDTEDGRTYWVSAQDHWIECKRHPHHACGYEVGWDEEKERRAIREEE